MRNLENWEITGADFDILWPDVDKNLSVQNLLRGDLSIWRSFFVELLLVELLLRR